MDRSQKHPSANALDMACTKQAEAMGFASTTTIGDEATPKGKKHYNQGKGKKRVGVAVASIGEDQPYIPVKLPLSREAHIKVMAVSLETTDAVLPSPLCAGYGV